MLEAFIMMGAFAAGASLVRLSVGGPVREGPAVVVLAGIWFAMVWLLVPAGGTGGPGWLHAGVIIAFLVLTSGGVQEPVESAEPSGPDPGTEKVEREESELDASAFSDAPAPERAHGDSKARSARGLWLMAGVVGILILIVIILPAEGPRPGPAGPHDGSTIQTPSPRQSISDAGSECRVVIDVCMPFPGQPEWTTQELNMGDMGTATIENYTYASDDTHIRFVAAVFSGLPAVADPPASLLRGFTRGHRIRMERTIEVNGIGGIWVTSEADNPVPSVWNVFAFEYEGRVYKWMETFELPEEIGDERTVFRERLTHLAPG